MAPDNGRNLCLEPETEPAQGVIGAGGTLFELLRPGEGLVLRPWYSCDDCMGFRISGHGTAVITAWDSASAAFEKVLFCSLW